MLTPKMPMPPPNTPIPYGKQTLDANDIEAVINVLKSDHLTQGPFVSEFEQALAKKCNVKFAVAFSSGTAALHAAMFVIGLKPGDRVITSANSFAASANGARFMGADIDFADIDPATALVTAQTIEEKISAQTKAIIPVDFAGRPVEIKSLQTLAQKYKIPLIIDSAHSLGAKFLGVDGNIHASGSAHGALMTILSFHPVKSITTGEGGVITTNDPQIAKKLTQFRQHGITKDHLEFPDLATSFGYSEMQFLGFNYRLTDIQAGLGISQLKKLDFFIAERRRLKQIYKSELKNICEFLADDDATQTSANHILPILLPKEIRDEVAKKMHMAKIMVQLHYRPIYLHPYYKKLYPQALCPQAELYAKRSMSIPLYPTLKDNEQEFIISTIKKILNQN